MQNNRFCGFVVMLSLVAWPCAAQSGATINMNSGKTENCQGELRQNLSGLHIKYPKALAEARVEGSVSVELRFNADQTLADTRVISGSPEFSGAVTDALKTWQSKADANPPDSSAVELEVDFRMKEEKQKPVPFPEVQNREDVVIELSRTSCLGDCRVYTIRLFGDGHVEYEGRSEVLITGKHRGQIPIPEFDALVDGFRRANYFSFEGYYTAPSTSIRAAVGECYVERSTEELVMDAPSVQTSIRIGSSTKRVEDESFPPQELEVLEGQIDTYSKQWTEGSPETVKGFLAEGRNINRQTVKGWPAILSACVYSDASVVQDFIRAGANVNSRGPDGVTPLMIAALRGDSAMVRALEQAGADVRARDRKGSDGLLRAIASGNESVVAIFLAAGADANEKDKNGVTPLILAAATGRPRIVKVLLDAKAKPNDRDKNGNAALMAAAGGFQEFILPGPKIGPILYNPDTRLPDRPAVVRMLVAAGAKIEASNDYADTVFSEASEDVVRELLAIGVDVNGRDEDGNVPLAKVRLDRDAKLLIDAGADIELTDAHGKTQLMYAVDDVSTEVLEVLIEAGAQIDRQDNDGWTALMYAV